MPDLQPIATPTKPLPFQSPIGFYACAGKTYSYPAFLLNEDPKWLTIQKIKHNRNKHNRRRWEGISKCSTCVPSPPYLQADLPANFNPQNHAHSYTQISGTCGQRRNKFSQIFLSCYQPISRVLPTAIPASSFSTRGSFLRLEEGFTFCSVEQLHTIHFPLMLVLVYLMYKLFS